MLFLLAMERELSAPSKQAVSNNGFQKTDRDIADKVESLLSTLSLIDKIGEMTQLTIDMISIGDPYNLSEPHKLDENKLKEVLLNHRVGSILNVGGHAYSLDHWHKIIHRIQDIAVNEKPSGIPVLYGIDTIHGANYVLGSTLFPQQVGLAATWNPELACQAARIGAYETRAAGIPWTFSPVLDVGRDPRWARFWETFGEDVYLTEQMGVAMAQGYQGKDVSHPHHVASTMKHFLGYSMPWTGKDRTQAWIPERQLREYFLPPFKAAVEAGALTIMINSGEINGIPVHADKHILTDLLRNELGFEGLAITDWDDIRYLYTRHKVAKDYKEAIKIAINAGVDMSMVPADMEYPRLLKELVDEGQVPMSRIDESVRRILTVKFKLGLFSRPYYSDKKLYGKFGSKAFVRASQKAAEESITLLKNEASILPLSPAQKILVTGPSADSLTLLNGGWSRTWQGVDASYDDKTKKTLLRCIREKAGDNNVTYVPGSNLNELLDIDGILTEARFADVAIVCLGEIPYTETLGDVNDLWLPEAQRELVKQVAATGTPVVLVLIEGRPRIISDIEPMCQAVVLGYLPSENGSEAVADILFGDLNPSGRLPFTYPRYPNDLVTYDHKYTDTIKGEAFRMDDTFNPQWQFGHGLSYTSFDYKNLLVDRSVFGPDDIITIRVEVKNTGKRAGMETVQLYVSDHVASVTPPVKRLRRFQKISLQPDEEQTVTFVIAPSDLAFVGTYNQWITEPGDFTIRVGPLSHKITYADPYSA